MKTLGPYVIQRKLGSGGMGVVYLAHHPELGQRALKVIHTHLSDHATLVRFQREFEALAAVSKHPHVVPVHTAGFDDGRLYYVMDAVDGQDLQVRLEGGRLPAREAAEILSGLSDAVATLHAAGVVHRDLKPANVLLDARGHAYLTDFGLARLLGDEQGRLTMTGELLGTPDYMAPEQALGLKEIGPPADVYALGLILFAALTGQRAISGKTRMEVLQQAAQGLHASLVELAPDTPQVLAEWVERCLAPEPAARPRAAELRDGLRAWLAEEAGPTVGDALRRERSHVGLAIAACVVLAVLLGLALAVALPRSRQRWEATLERVASQVEAHEASLLEADRAGAPPLPPLARELAGLEPPSPEAAEAQDALRALLWAVEADSAARRSDTEACAAAVEACSPPATLDRELRRRVEAHLDGARAWLHVEGGLPAEDVRAIRRGVERARERWPERRDLLALCVRLALDQDRPGEALDLLAQAPTPLPALHLEVALAGDDLQELGAALAAEGLPPELEARALLRLAADEVALEPGRALERVRRAVDLQPEGLQVERAALRERTEAELATADARWGQLPPKQAVATFVTRLDRHELLDVLDPGYTLGQDEIGEMGVAALKLGKWLPEEAGGGARLFERAIQIGPEDPGLFSWYTRFAISRPNLDLYRRGLVVTDENPTLMASFARALAMKGMQPELRALVERFGALHAQRYPAQLSVAVVSLANLLVRESGQLPAGSPEELAQLEEVLTLFRRVYTLEPTNRSVLISSIGVVERLRDRPQGLEHVEQALWAATHYLELATAMRSSPVPSLTSEVEYVARTLLAWSPPERQDEVLARVDATLAEQPEHLWLALRRLELALERGEDPAGVAERLDFTGRTQVRQALLEKRMRTEEAPRWEPDREALERLERELPRLRSLLAEGELEAAAELAKTLREGLPEHEDAHRQYAGPPRRAF